MSESGGNHDRSNALWEEGFGNSNVRQATLVPNNGSLYSGHEQFGIAPTNDNYTVLPIGNGGFIKVYHNNDESMNFSNYELFSSNNFSPQNMIKTIQPQQEAFFHPDESGSINDESNTSVFINQLVEQNWAPNNSGTYSQFGEQLQHQPLLPREHFMNYNTPPMNTPDNYNYPTAQSNYNSPQCLSAVNSPPSMGTNQNSTSGTNGSFQNESILKKNDVKKPRMVAEVKPMRMTYSDVLSKNVSLTKTDGTANNATANGGPNVQPKLKSGKTVEKNNKSNSNIGVDKKVVNSSDDKDSATVNKVKGSTGFIQKTENV